MRSWLHASRRPAAVVAALALTGLSMADANPPAPVDAPRGLQVDSPRVRAARRIALAFWREAPCDGRVAITWARLPGRTNAVSSWTNRRGSYADPPANRDCRVRFNAAAHWTWPKFCTVMVHEFGHLTGHQHSANPLSVMVAGYDGAIAACLPADRG